MADRNNNNIDLRGDFCIDKSGSAKTNDNEDEQNRMFLIRTDNDNAFEVRIENFDSDVPVGGAKKVNDSMFTCTRQVDDRGHNDSTHFDIYQLMLQNQLLTQQLLMNKGLQPDVVTTTRRTATVSVPSESGNKRARSDDVATDNVAKNKRTRTEDSYNAALDELFQDQEHVAQASQTLHYDDVSDYDETEEVEEGDIEYSDSNDPACVETSATTDEQIMSDNNDVLEMMKEFLNNDEKSGPKIHDSLAKIVNESLRNKSNQQKIIELSKKYCKPSNVNSLKVPKVNSGVWRQLKYQTKDVDVKLQSIQNVVGKGLSPLLYLLDRLIAADGTNKGMSKEKVKECANLCNDAYQLFKEAFITFNYRRRLLLKPDIKHKYKDLCSDDTPITNLLFGDNIKDMMSKMDAEYNVGNKVGKNSSTRGGFSFRRGFGRGFRGTGRRPNPRRGGFSRHHSSGNEKPEDFLEKGEKRKKHKKLIRE